PEQPKGGDVWDQIIKQSADQVNKDRQNGAGADLPQRNQTTTPDAKGWCEQLLKANVSNLPPGYSNPRISSTELTPQERAAGVICKITVNLQGPDPFDAVCFRIFNSVAAAERGLKSLPKLVPEISVFESRPQIHGRETPCMVYTSGNRTLQFVSCADQVKGTPIVVSGVSSERYRDSYSMNTVFNAGSLLEAAEHHCASITSGLGFVTSPAASHVEQLFDEGNNEIKQKRYDEAIASYTKVIQLKPNDAKAYSNRGIAYILKDLYDKAI